MLRYEERGQTRWLVPGTYIRETDDAYLINIQGREHWLPKSQVYMCNDDAAGEWVAIPEWLCTNEEISVG